MSYNTLIASEIDANSPVDEALMTKIKDNFDYLKTEQDTIKTDVNASVSVGNIEGAKNDAAVMKTNSDTTTWTKNKEIKLVRGGVIRINFEGYTNQSGGKAKIYKNGSPVGTQQSLALSSYSGFSEDISGFTSGDLLQVYTCNTFSAGKNQYIKNLRLHSAEGYYLGGGNLNY